MTELPEIYMDKVFLNVSSDWQRGEINSLNSICVVAMSLYLWVLIMFQPSLNLKVPRKV